MTEPSIKTDIYAEEAEFHNRWARSQRVEDINVRAAFEAPTAPENRFILKKMGNIEGKKLLDIGAGLGESSVYFALRGAKVTCTDLSPGMVDFAIRLGQHHGVELDGMVCPAEELSTPDNTYDIVYVANSIHHITDKELFFRQVARTLKPGGRIFSWDPIAYNPIINIYRRMATEVRSENEAPLTFLDLQTVRRHFIRVGHREFWITTLAIFMKYYLINHVHPNQDRYWKRILAETPASLWWWYPLKVIDDGLTRIPLVRRLAWNMVVWGEKPA